MVKMIPRLHISHDGVGHRYSHKLSSQAEGLRVLRLDVFIISSIRILTRLNTHKREYC
jgi:hypothetical protein